MARGCQAAGNSVAAMDAYMALAAKKDRLSKVGGQGQGGPAVKGGRARLVLEARVCTLGAHRQCEGLLGPNRRNRCEAEQLRGCGQARGVSSGAALGLSAASWMGQSCVWIASLVPHPTCFPHRHQRS